MRPHPILPVACVALLAIGSTAMGQTASRPARIGMLCATVCPTVVLDELRQLGWIEGSTILIDRKPAASRLERLPQLAKELVQSRPDLIIATSVQPVRAAKVQRCCPWWGSGKVLRARRRGNSPRRRRPWVAGTFPQRKGWRWGETPPKVDMTATKVGACRARKPS